ncbi:MAG TPA: tetratricopeptide repeat-containing protein [Thermoleophilaceae bacterium]|nr:tetratricopeptide repeat-containing protein [Thermoleophilaceae bacterium]
MATADIPAPTDVEVGTRIVRGDESATPGAMLALALDLVEAQQFGLARKLLRRARKGGLATAEEATKARQQHALCTYKDPDAPVTARLRRALEILADGEDLAATTDAETLGIAGAIHKRRWEATMRVSELERALEYYHRGYLQGLGQDGYAAINAAFVLDLLADTESTGGGAYQPPDAAVAARRDAADAIRRDIVTQLGPVGERRPGEWWLQATLAEAQLGLGDYPAAKRWLERCRAIPDVPEWRIESTSRQLGALAMLRARTPDGDLDAGARAALQALLGDRQDAITRAYAGKLGIALSGGGFRASLFHIGVLAHLAEIDALRHVEVLSCVSGGSIVGAHYYLEVQRLLEAKPEADIDRDDYVAIVETIEERFLAGVRSNIRMRVIGNALSNLWSIVTPAWTRTKYAGRLYESRIYASVDDGRGGEPRYMDQLLVAPHGEDDGGGSTPQFNPKRDNWRRRCKVPVLVLNATTLNTGHNWQFTASWMGEPPAVVDEDIDTNPRLRRMYYRDAPRRWRRMRLGEAVAASACVPGLFDPLVLPGLYEGTTVELVDGGVHDNQGVATLLEQECALMLVSDASGQMRHQDVPRRGPLAVPLRSSSILSARVREAQLRDLLARHSSSTLRGLGVIHLRKGLGEPPRDWLDCPDPYERADDVLADGEPSDDYGIPPGVQALLARMRTDLDAFSELEAYALMLSGYRMARHAFGPALSELPIAQAPARPKWGFLRAADVVAEAGPGHERLKRVLAVGAGRWGKVWRLSPALRWIGALVAAVAGVAALWGLWQARDAAILTPGALLAVGAVLVLGAVVARLLARRLDPLGTAFRVTTGLLLVAAAIPAWAQIHLLDRVYQRAGRLKDGRS